MSARTALGVTLLMVCIHLASGCAQRSAQPIFLVTGSAGSGTSYATPVRLHLATDSLVGLLIRDGKLYMLFYGGDREIAVVLAGVEVPDEHRALAIGITAEAMAHGAVVDLSSPPINDTGEVQVRCRWHTGFAHRDLARSIEDAILDRQSRR
jgi:hypothetical protein